MTSVPDDIGSENWVILSHEHLVCLFTKEQQFLFIQLVFSKYQNQFYFSCGGHLFFMFECLENEKLAAAL